MQKQKKVALTVKAMASLAMLTAISIILGKYLALPIGEVLRFSFENLPIIFAGIAFGPFAAVLVAVCADLLGCIMVGFTVNPIVTAGAAAIGLISGAVPLIFRNGSKKRSAPIIALTVSLSHLIGSVVVKTFGLAVFYDMHIGILMLWRLFNYCIVAALEILLLTLLFKNKALLNQLGKITGKT